MNRNLKTVVFMLLFGLFIGALWQDEMATISLIEGGWYDFPFQLVRVHGLSIWVVRDLWRMTMIACYITTFLILHQVENQWKTIKLSGNEVTLVLQLDEKRGKVSKTQWSLDKDGNLTYTPTTVKDATLGEIVEEIEKFVKEQ